MLRLLYCPTHIHTRKTIDLTIQTFVGKITSLFFNTLSRFVIAFLPRSRRLLISWLQPPSPVILEPKKIKSVTRSFLDHLFWTSITCSPAPLPTILLTALITWHIYLFMVYLLTRVHFFCVLEPCMASMHSKKVWMNEFMRMIAFLIPDLQGSGKAKHLFEKAKHLFVSLQTKTMEAWALAQEHRGWTTDPDRKWTWKSSLGLRKDIRAPVVGAHSSLGWSTDEIL